MQTIRKVLQRAHHAFQQHHPTIFFMSLCTFVPVAFLHFQYKQNNKDFIYWHNLMQRCWQELHQVAMLSIMLVILMKIILIGVLIVANKRSVNSYDELSQLEIKKRYADFLLLRLIADIDTIDTKYLRGRGKRDVIVFKSFILAHENMKKSVEQFRRDALKLLTPNEFEITQPIERVYGVLEREVQYVKRSKFYKMDIEADEGVIRKLVNPTS